MIVPKVTLAFILVVVTANVQADPQVSGNDKPVQSGSQQQQVQTDKQKEVPSKPATTFTPSEKVGADSAVAFPVDI